MLGGCVEDDELRCDQQPGALLHVWLPLPPRYQERGVQLRQVSRPPSPSQMMSFHNSLYLEMNRII